MKTPCTALIRRYRPSDQAAARALIEKGLGEHFGFVDRNANPDLIDISASYAMPPNTIFVADLDGAVIGTTALVVRGDVGRLVRVAVARNHRRAGVATALMTYVIGYARQVGVSQLTAQTQPEWSDAMRFYERHGFVPCGRDEIDVHLCRSLVVPKERSVAPADERA